MLSLLLLGSPQIVRDGESIEIARRKSRALLFYLATRTSPATRDHLLTQFWPDLERAAAQQVLRTTLHGLRKSLGDQLLITNNAVELAATVQVDSRRFEQLGTISNLDQLALTLALYRGVLLEAFTLPDSEQFDRWLELERERFQQLALRGYIALAQLQEAQQNFPAALSTLIRATALDPLHEDVQRAAMRVQYRSGDRAGAIRRFEQLRDQLDGELGVPPMAETRALYDAIITDALEDGRSTESPLAHLAGASRVLLPHHLGATSGALPFTGRSAQLARITAAAEAGRLVMIEGEPGIGKTRLAREWLASSGALILAGAAYELEQALPYQPFIEALRSLCEQADGGVARKTMPLAPIWRAEVARLLPELGDQQAVSSGPADESRLWEAVRQMLLALAQVRPVALFLDDIHWADESTLALLGYLARQLSGAHVTLLVTSRLVAPRSGLATLIQTLTRAGRIERLVLQRLTASETATLARELSPTHGQPLAAWLEPAAEGNPYVLAELVRYARERAWLRPNGALDLAALQRAPVVPHTIYSLIESRLAPLSPDARAIIDMAVAAGREFDFPLVALASGMSETRVLDALDEVRAAGLVRPVDEQRFRFDHSLTMEVAYREVGEPRHRTLHRRLAEALIQRASDDGDVAGVIATHFAEGNAPTQAAPYALLAGQRAMTLAAWQEAIGFFELALHGNADQRLAALIALGEARGYAGASAQASEALRAAIELAEQRGDEKQAATARLWLARALIPQGRYAEVIATVQPLLATDEAASAEFFWGAALSLEGADLDAARVHIRNSERLLAVIPAHDNISIARVQFELGNIAAQQGDLATAVQFFREIVDASATRADAASLSWNVLAYNNLAYHLHLQGDPEALAFAHAGLALAQEKGTLANLPYLYSTIGEIQLANGELDHAERSFVEGLQLSEQMHVPERVAGITANLGRVAQARSQTTLAIHLLSTAQARADTLGTHHLAAQIRIWLAPLLPAEQARATLAEARALAENGGRRRLLADIVSLEEQEHPH